VIIWDANFEEYWIWDKANENKNYNPKHFFASNHHKIKYIGNYE
jgi:hypothetical protein